MLCWVCDASDSGSPGRGFESALFRLRDAGDKALFGSRMNQLSVDSKLEEWFHKLQFESLACWLWAASNCGSFGFG